jgi:type IV pilus assembly protein PilC
MAKKTKKEKLHTFNWRGISVNGMKENGEIEAASVRVARMMLRQRRIKVVRIKKEAQPLIGGAKVKNRDIVIMTRQLAVLVEGGIPIAESLSAVGNSSDNSAVRKLLRKIRASVETGNNLTDSLRQHREYFNPLYVGLVGVGEDSGTLGPMLARIATYLEKAEALKGKVKSALTYPVIVTILGTAIASGLLIFIIPQFQTLFNNFGAELPMLTRKVIGASEFMQANWWIVFGGLFVISYIHRQMYRRSLKVETATDKAILKIPVFGELIRKSILAKVARTIAIMFRAGIPMVETLATVGPASGNQVYVQSLAKVRTDVSTGHPLEASLRDAKVFPAMILQMVKTGEETGELDAMLDRAADFYEDEVDNMVAAISSLVEPILVVVLGVMIGTVVIAMYLPIFNLASVF